MPPADIDDVAKDVAVLSARSGDFSMRQEKYNDGLKRTLYGESGTNGLSGRMRDAEGRLGQLEAAQRERDAQGWDKRLVWLSTGLGIMGGIATTLLLKALHV